MALNFELNLFKDLCYKFPTWNELSKYLESNEGGSLRIVDTNDKGICIIRYEKESSSADLHHSNWFRSVVWDTNINRPVCLAPPKTTTDIFKWNNFKDLSNDGVICQELLDGFMINCFRVVGDNTLHITSRSKLNATGKFYSKKTFRELFIEAYMNTGDCPHYSETIIQDNSNDIRSPDPSKNEIAIFYSFLVQHQEHRIVKKVEKNRVFVIHTGIVFDDGRIEIQDTPVSFKGKSNIDRIVLDNCTNKLSYANVVSSQNEEGCISEVEKWIKKMLSDKPWDFQGIVFKDKTGNRWRFRSEKYSIVKSLRGNSADARDRFSQLFTQNLVFKYLEYYEEDLVIMTSYLMLVNTLVKILYDNYLDIHVTKVKKINEINKLYHPYLYNIHGNYLTHLKPNNNKVNMNEIHAYLYKQPWQRISFLIKKTLELINSEDT